MRKVFNWGVTIWIILNVMVFLLPSVTACIGDLGINETMIDKVMLAANKIAGVILGIIGLVAYRGEKDYSEE